MPATVDIQLPMAEIAEICRRHDVRELSLFGSAARGEMRPDSDLDFLIDFEPDAQTDLLELSAMVREFTSLLGRRVDLAVKPGLKPSVKAEILTETRPIYEA